MASYTFAKPSEAIWKNFIQILSDLFKFQIQIV